MSLRDEYLRVKGRWKQRLGIGSANTSSPSAEPGIHQSRRSLSPMPQILSHPQTQTASGITDITGISSDPSRPDPSRDVRLSTGSITVTTPTLAIPTQDKKPQAEPSRSEPAIHNIAENDGLPVATSERTKAAAWSGLKSLLEVLKSSSDAFPPLQSAVGGLNSFTASQGREEYEELGTALDSLLRDMSGYVGHRAGPRMTTSVKNLWIGLDEELKLIQEKLARGEIRRHMEALDDAGEVFKSYRRIHGHLERLALNANLSVWEAVNESATETRLRGLSPALSAVYNSAKSIDVKRRLCTPGTREKELDKLLGWARNKTTEAEDVYWMNGMAGTGKTTIACSLCAELEKSSELGASFFCSRQLPECRDVSLIIPCIAYQLARFSIPFRHALSNVLEADPDVHTRVLTTQFENLLVEPLTKVKSALPADFVVVIDALDECDSEDSVGQILGLLLSHTSIPSLPVRFLISSRPESKIYNTMMTRLGHAVEARLVLHDLDAEAVKLDIKTYLEAELAVVGLTPAQLTKLVELSGVLFIFASTMARYITEGQELMEHEDRLNMVLGLSAESTSDKDRAIDQLYSSILQAVSQKKNINKPTWTRLKTLLDTVICARDPMTTDGLAGLLGEKSGKHVEMLLRQLSSVLDIAESTGLVTALHASFPDYMLDPERSLSFHCDPIGTHARLSRVCLEAIITQQPQFNLCALESSYLLDEQDPRLDERTSKMVSSQLFYACRYWVAHLELSGRPDNAREILWDFLSKRLLLWMEVLNVKKCMELGPSIIQRAESWSRTNACSEETIELAHDAWRFVTMFAGHAVSRSTPHIYVSMLPFWPSSSPISKHYETWRYGGVQPQGSAMTQRRLALLATWMFDEHPDAVCFSPDGSLIAVGVYSSVYIIDSITGRTVLGPLVHGAEVRTATFSPDGMLLATGSQDCSIRMWARTNGDLVWQAIDAHIGYVLALSFFPNGTRLLSGGDDSFLRVWDTGTGAIVLGPISGHLDPVLSASVSPDGTRIASGSTDKTVRVWNAQTGSMVLGPLEGHMGRVESVCFSPDGLWLVSGSWDSTIRVWGNLTGAVTVELLQGHTDQVNAVEFSSDGKYIISGSRDNTIRLWHGSGDFGCIAVLQGHMETVLSLAVSFDGTRIVSGSHDKTVRVWDARTHAATNSPLSGHTSSVTSISVSPDGHRILSASDDSTLCVWDAQSGQLAVGPFRGHTDWVYSACFSPDGTRIVSGSTDKTVRWWDARNGNQVCEPMTGHTDQVLSVCFSPDGSLVASGSVDTTILLWDAQSREVAGSPLQGHTGNVWSVCFSSDGSRLVSGSADTLVMVWDLESRQHALPPLQGHTDVVGSVCMSHDDARIASGSADKTIRLWDAQTGGLSLGPLQGHSDGVNGVKFSPDSRYLLSCSSDKTLRIWNAHTGEAIGNPLLGHTEEVRSCSFSPCGKWVLSGSADSNIRVWKVTDLVEAPRVEDTVQNHVCLNDQFLTTFEFWHFQEDGWVADSQNRLLTWVPPDLHRVLASPRNEFLISADGSFLLEFDLTKLGEKWIDSYTS